jgi:hypothetical protein
MAIDVVVAGHICLDIIPQFMPGRGSDLSAYLSPGRLSEVGPMTLSTGGGGLEHRPEPEAAGNGHSADGESGG